MTASRWPAASHDKSLDSTVPEILAFRDTRMQLGIHPTNSNASNSVCPLLGQESRVSTSAGRYIARLPGRQMGRSAVSNGIGGDTVNTGMHYGTTPRKDWSTRDALGALAGGILVGSADPHSNRRHRSHCPGLPDDPLAAAPMGHEMARSPSHAET
ncbi:hypothetical protein GCM10017711_04580 [Paeniglutamicibacter sulfureus]